MTTILIVMFSLPVIVSFSVGYLLYVGKLKTGVPRIDKAMVAWPGSSKLIGIGNVIFGFYMIYVCAEFIEAFGER